MAGVERVEYLQNSTAGVASQGDKVEIKPDNAAKMQKDMRVSDGRDIDHKIIDVDDTQRQRINVWAESHPDDVDYSEQDAKDAGRGEIRPFDEDGKPLDDKSDKEGAITGAVSSCAGLVFMVATLKTLEIGKKTASIGDGFLQLAVAIGMGVCAALSLVTAFLFDPDLKERENQTSNADTDIEILNSHSSTLEDDMVQMENDRDLITKLSEDRVGAFVSSIDEAEGKQAEIAARYAQGDVEGARALEEECAPDKIEKERNEVDAGFQEEIGNLVANLEGYELDVNYGEGMFEGGTSVQEFLHQGYALKTYADINAYAAMACGAIGILLAAVSTPKWLLDVPANTGARVLFGVSGALFLVTSIIMMKTSSKEHEAGKKSSEMNEPLEKLRMNIDNCAVFKDDASGYYSEIADESAKAIGDAQKNSEAGVNASASDEFIDTELFSDDSGNETAEV